MSGSLYYPLGYINPAQVYLMAPYLWDALIFLLIFLGLTTYVFKSKGHFGKKGGPVAIGVGLALTISLVTFMYLRGWYIGMIQFSIIPLLILVFLFIYLFYILLKDLFGMETRCAIAIAFMLGWPAMNLVDVTFWELGANYPLLGGILTFLYLAAFIMFVVCVVQFAGIKRKDSDDNDGGSTRSSSNGNGNGRGGSDSPDGSQDDSTAPDGQTRGLQDRVERVEGLLRALTTELDAWLADGNATLRVNHGYVHNLGPTRENREEAKTQFTSHSRAIREALDAIAADLQAIGRNPHVTTLPEDYVQRLANAHRLHLGLMNQMSTYWTQWQTLYSAAEVPP